MSADRALRREVLAAFVDGDEAVRQALHVWADWLEAHEDGLGPILRVYTAVSADRGTRVEVKQEIRGRIVVAMETGTDDRIEQMMSPYDPDVDIPSAHDFTAYDDGIEVVLVQVTP